jgi:hypothetical protein
MPQYVVHVRSSCLHGDDRGRARALHSAHAPNNRGIGQRDKHVLLTILLTIDALGCAFLRVQDACVNCCPLFYDRSFPLGF